MTRYGGYIEMTRGLLNDPVAVDQAKKIFSRERERLETLLGTKLTGYQILEKRGGESDVIAWEAEGPERPL